ncbi:MAG: NAD(P)H-quinone oxidoreductase [Burkholderiaceae bacterium]
MTAVELNGFGGPEVLAPARLPMPVPAPGELLIRVHAAGVNRPDVQQRRGQYNPPPGASPIPGLEIAGEVVALGDGCKRFRLGDKVCALVAGGGYAEYCVAPEAQTLPVPEPLTMIEAAGVPETFFTVWTNVFDRGRLLRGESLLVHGGSSGIGTTAIQLAKAFGSTVYVTVGNADKADACLKLGADHAIVYRDTDFVDEIRRLTGKRGVDVILDMVGGDYLSRNLDSLAVEGRLVQIAWLGGSRIEADFMKILTRRLTWTGSTLRPRTVEQKAEIARALEQRVWPLLAAGTIKPVIHKTFPLAQARQAHELMESSDHIGKIILEA